MSFSHLPLHLESILDRAFSQTHGNHEIRLAGLSSKLPVAWLLAHPQSPLFAKRKNLIVLPTHEEALEFIDLMKFVDPESQHYIHLLPPHDVSPYSGLFNSRHTLGQRLRWLHFASTQHHPLFVSSVTALMQYTLPKDILRASTFVIKTGTSLQSDLSQKLLKMGYQESSLVEDIGTFSLRGSILDIFSPARSLPIRCELFGDVVDSIKVFDPTSQRSLDSVEALEVLPMNEVVLGEETKQRALAQINQRTDGASKKSILHSVLSNSQFQGIEFFLSDFYEKPSLPLDFFNGPYNVWNFYEAEQTRTMDSFLTNLKDEHKTQESIVPSPEHLYQTTLPNFKSSECLVKIESVFISEIENEEPPISYVTTPVKVPSDQGSGQGLQYIKNLLQRAKAQSTVVFVACSSTTNAQRVRLQLAQLGFQPKITEALDASWKDWEQEQIQNTSVVHIVPRSNSESLQLPEDRLLFLREKDFSERSVRSTKRKEEASAATTLKAINFSDLSPGDPIVHLTHGIGIYEGLKIMELQGQKNEYLQIKYKDSDRLYLPVYKLSLVHKFSAPFSAQMVDKLGGTSWEKAKIKVRGHLREVAAELLKIYAERARVSRPTYSEPNQEFLDFENQFPFEETDDQVKSIEDILSDLARERPMDRLICGDVGFGKTEVAMRAAFRVVQEGKQVAVLVPTTILAFQHEETFRKRFKGWPIKIASLSRLTSNKDVTKNLTELKAGQIDIVIGTHKLFSRDVEFKNLGLLIVDEEQRFGVVHKEKLRKLRADVDTLTLSATPIPRTLNMSLMGIRDISLISTPPQDRLPIRTFIFKNNPDIIKKAVTSEIQRGGQVLYVHNRVQSIYTLEQELKELLPGVRIRVGHGQMESKQLEDTILSFFKHDYDLLLSTTIIESGMDMPRANTMVVDRPEMFGLSQLYQLRGRVGRGNERGYCYLMIPPKGIDAHAQERLKVLQENTALGSGLKVAQYDMELRGTGDILGESQSGHANMVGHELYLELLEEAIHEAQGEPYKNALPEPEINLRIPAFIPDEYMPDIRIRLSIYKSLSDANSPQDVERIEEDLRDRFGPVPPEVLNLLGVILIRNECAKISVKELNVSSKNLLLNFHDKPVFSPEKIIQLALTQAQKYKLQPNNRFAIKLEEQDWAKVFEELAVLKQALLP
ncbi:MAG: transcription-repair coupling factor [Bdellovibrionales bacterium]